MIEIESFGVWYKDLSEVRNWSASYVEDPSLGLWTRRGRAQVGHWEVCAGKACSTRVKWKRRQWSKKFVEYGHPLFSINEMIFRGVLLSQKGSIHQWSFLHAIEMLLGVTNHLSIGKSSYSLNLIPSITQPLASKNHRLQCMPLVRDPRSFVVYMYWHPHVSCCGKVTSPIFIPNDQVPYSPYSFTGSNYRTGTLESVARTWAMQEQQDKKPWKLSSRVFPNYHSQAPFIPLSRSTDPALALRSYEPDRPSATAVRTDRLFPSSPCYFSSFLRSPPISPPFASMLPRVTFATVERYSHLKGCFVHEKRRRTYIQPVIAPGGSMQADIVCETRRGETWYDYQNMITPKRVTDQITTFGGNIEAMNQGVLGESATSALLRMMVPTPTKLHMYDELSPESTIRGYRQRLDLSKKLTGLLEASHEKLWSWSSVEEREGTPHPSFCEYFGRKSWRGFYLD